MNLGVTIDGLAREMRFAWRGMRKSPGFSALAILIIGLGIGANTAIFSVFDAVILRPLPYPEPERLMMLPASHRPNFMGTEVSVANFLDWRRESRSFLSRVFNGAAAPAVLHLLSECEADDFRKLPPEEIERLRQLLDEAGPGGGREVTGRTRA